MQILGHALAPAFLGLLAGYLIAVDVEEFWHSERGTGVVRETAVGRSGLTMSVVDHTVAATPVRADLRAWNRYLEVGERVAITYRRGRPEVVAIDSFWQLHYAATGALVAFAVAAIYAVSAIARDRRAARARPGVLKD